jgi:hypothetical protein
MKHLVIMLLCSFPVLASANWAGFPFTNNPVTNWPDVVTNFDPLAQLHSAGIERRQVAGADIIGTVAYHALQFFNSFLHN